MALWIRPAAGALIRQWHVEAHRDEQRGLRVASCGTTYSFDADLQERAEPPSEGERCPACQGVYSRAIDQQLTTGGRISFGEDYSSSGLTPEDMERRRKP